MNHQYQSLVLKLKEIFQINRPDLDFGIYRILNARRDEIGEFLDKRLQAKVQTALGEAKTKLDQTAIADLQKEIRDEFGRRAFDENNQLVEEEALASDLGQKYLALTQQDAKALDDETQVYNHLLTFFSRYYDEGDFISQRRYKGDTYSIPYAGEEVMLHWANKDQYYTKSGEMFSNYRFKLEDGKSILFRLISADTARENRKDNDKDRRFVIVTEPRTLTRVDDEGEEYEETIEPFSIVDGELTILFEYKAFTSKTKQEELNKQSAEKILSASILDEQWLKGLKTLEPTEKDPKRTLLDKHLSSYTQKHTADYFIHKDLGGFLSRELDFFIKNEVMHLDDVVSTVQFADIERQLSIIKCLRVIGTEIINFLASLENFQKLQAYINNGKHVDELKNYSVYLLRNADSKYKGLGFALAGNFYPDFLLWLVHKETGMQYLTLVDPKGLRNMDHDHAKIKLHQEIKHIEARVCDPNLVLNSFILSITPMKDIVNNSLSQEEYAERNVLFMVGDDKTYLDQLFSKILEQQMKFAT